MYTIIHVYWSILVPLPLASIGERFSASQREERIRERKGGCVCCEGKGVGPKQDGSLSNTPFPCTDSMQLWVHSNILKPIGCSLTRTLEPDWIQDVTSGSWKPIGCSLKRPLEPDWLQDVTSGTCSWSYRLRSYTHTRTWLVTGCDVRILAAAAVHSDPAQQYQHPLVGASGKRCAWPQWYSLKPWRN